MADHSFSIGAVLHRAGHTIADRAEDTDRTNPTNHTRHTGNADQTGTMAAARQDTPRRLRRTRTPRTFVFRLLAFLLSCGLALTGLAGCGNAQAGSSAGSAGTGGQAGQNGTKDGNLAQKELSRVHDNGHRTVTVMLDWTPNTNHAGLYVAQRKDFYRMAGLDVTILPAAQAGAESSVETGVANVGFTTLSNVAAVDAQGSHLRFVFDLTQKPVARWCALASNASIRSPKDFSGKTFVSFGSAEQTAVVRQMIAKAGGKPDFSTVTVGTSTFQTLASGRGDFAGFYQTWEGVQSRLDGPKLRCYKAQDWGVPGNPDQLGFAVNTKWAKSHEKTLARFVKATKKGYRYALEHPDEAARILVSDASSAALDPKLATASMQEIVKGGYWGDERNLGHTDFTQAQKYLTFLASKGVFAQRKNDGTKSDEPGTKGDAASGAQPNARRLATNAYVDKE